MPRQPTTELAYVPLQAEVAAFGPAKAVLQAGWEKLLYNIDQPAEPILFRLFIPKITVKKLNATFTIFLVDVTGAAQIIQEVTNEGITAASNSSPAYVERRIVPEKDFTVEPGKEGQRSLTIEAEVSSETVTIPANTAKCLAYLQILGLGRQ